jgi:hypothetical protein
MSIPKFNDLFRDSGPQETLELLFSKIGANDLSADEALAMLSAVHNELGQGAATDIKVYQLYASFMKLLQNEKPDIYDHVVSSWNHKIKADSSEMNDWDTNNGESVASDSNLHGVEANSESGFGNVKVEEGGSNEDEEPQEPGEIEEKEINQSETIEKTGEEPESVKMDEEEPEEEESNQVDIKNEEAVQSENDKVDDRIEETETAEPQEEEKDPVEEEAEPEDNESESEGSDSNEVYDESTVESEKGEPEGEGEVEEDETEWPEIEQPQPDELFNGLEVEDDPPQGEN